MLITCPECSANISDKAISCPHCGYPLQLAPPQARKQRSKRMRLPNGFGTITEVKNQRLRNPYRAMICIGKNSVGKPIYTLLKPQAYFRTYNEAYTALVEYHKNPYDLSEMMTMKELYEKWSEYHYKDLSIAAKEGMAAAWKYCYLIYDTPVRNIRARHVRACLFDSQVASRAVEKTGVIFRPSKNVRRKIKSLLSMMLEYAIEFDLTDTNYAKNIKLDNSGEVQKQHVAFTSEEMQILWANSGKYQVVKIILIQCYSGWRASELLSLTVDMVNSKDGYCIGGMKTKAGKNRTVPIHSCVRPFVEEFYNAAIAHGRKYLFCTEDTNEPLTYDNYRYRFVNIINALGLNKEHRTHDCRKQFVTMAKAAGMDEYALKRIVGHAITDMTEGVYTERPLSWLIEEMEKIKGN